MSSNFRINKNKLGLISLLIVVLGIMVRFNVYLQNRSLFLDEANLARNIVEKDYTDFFKALDYEQYAPPFFLVISKVSTELFGVNEFALRLLSHLAGIAALLMLLKLANLLISEDASRWYVLLLLSFSMLSIRYSSEFKQYASDAAITLFFIFWALKAKDKVFDLTQTVKWALLGSLAIWFSMPIIFVLASIGLAFLYEARKRMKIIYKSLLPIGATWLVSFGLYFYLLLYTDASTDGLLEYHSEFFFNFFPTNLASMKQNWELIQSLFRSATDKTTLGIVWAMLSFLIGAIVLIRKEKFVAILLLLPIFFCLIASHLHFYSLLERLTLFMIPLFMIVIGVGISYLWSKSKVVIKFLMVGLMILSVVNKNGYRYYWTRLEKEDSKSVMRYLSEHKEPGELVYVQWDGVPAFVFYNEMYDKAWKFQNYHLANWAEEPSVVIPAAINSSKSDRFWLFFSHTFPEENIAKNIISAKKIAIELDRYNSIEASTYCFKLKN